MNAVIAAAGPLGVPVAEELVRACWGIDTLYYDESNAPAGVYEKFRKHVSFAVKEVPEKDCTWFWKNLRFDSEAMLFLIGAPEPPLEVLKTKPETFYALQPGLLPEQAGADAASWALYKGHPRTGVTLYRRGAKPYSGELVFRETCLVEESDDAGTLEKKLEALAVKLVRDFWEQSTRAKVRERGHVETANVNPPWKGEPIPWGESTRNVHNFVRASTHPRGGAATYLNGRRLTVWKTTPLRPRGEIKKWHAGEIYSFDPFRVWTGDGLIKLDRVQWEGEPEIPGTEFARTRGIEAGVTLDDHPQTIRA
jgi:hypothetical protein